MDKNADKHYRIECDEGESVVSYEEMKELVESGDVIGCRLFRNNEYETIIYPKNISMETSKTTEKLEITGKVIDESGKVVGFVCNNLEHTKEYRLSMNKVWSLIFLGSILGYDAIYDGSIKIIKDKEKSMRELKTYYM